jgi:uncharacterized protein (TIGR03083 family)
VTDYAAALLEQNRLFGELISDADPTTPVPTCPGWSLQQLFRHLGRGHRWAAQIIREKLDAPLDPRAVVDGKPPADQEGALGWLSASGQAVLDAVAETGRDVPVWTFLGPRPAGWWIRRRLHEATVHRADASIALGVEYDLSPELAADGIAEWLELIVAEVGAGPRDNPIDPGASIHVHATDYDGEWILRSDASGLTLETGHDKSAVAARGRAVDLLRVLTRRRVAEDVDVRILGATEVWTDWLARTPF